MTSRILYRVFPYLSGARKGMPGHALHVPVRQGAGRLDNPEHYLVLYASDRPAGAVAEAFGNLMEWSERMFSTGPGYRRSLAILEAPTEVIDMDDGRTLTARKLRPSQVVTRDYSVTQAWALGLFQMHRWGGVRWWSRHESLWGSFGIWDRQALPLVDVEQRGGGHTAVEEARDLLPTKWVA